jgi:uncharacterized protein
MDKTTLTNLLRSQNPWWEDAVARQATRFPFRRFAFAHLLEQFSQVHSRRAVILMGPRQVGKTVLLWQIIDALLTAGYPAPNLVYCDFSDPRLANQVSLQDVVDCTASNRAGSLHELPTTFIFDEVHFSPQWDMWLKRFVDDARGRFLLTDSLAYLLRTGMESGQGRWYEIRIDALSFAEFYQLRHGSTEVDPLVAHQEVRAYLLQGGYPEHVYATSLKEVHQLLRDDIVSKAIARDLERTFKVRRLDSLEKLFVALVGESGSMFEATGRSNDLRVPRQTVVDWLRFLEDTGLLRQLPAYSPNLHTQLRARPKVYATDPGLVAAFSVSVDAWENRGRLVETAVFRHAEEFCRVRGGSAHFYRKGRLAADFVLCLPEGTVVAEVTAAETPRSAKHHTLARVATEIGASEALFIYYGLQEDCRSEGTLRLHYMPLWQFLYRCCHPSTQTLSSLWQPGMSST